MTHHLSTAEPAAERQDLAQKPREGRLSRASLGHEHHIQLPWKVKARSPHHFSKQPLHAAPRDGLPHLAADRESEPTAPRARQHERQEMLLVVLLAAVLDEEILAPLPQSVALPEPLASGLLAPGLSGRGTFFPGSRGPGAFLHVADSPRYFPAVATARR
jgi:hypothetical protein